MNIAQKQDEFIHAIEQMSDWQERFTWLIKEGNHLPTRCPAPLLAHPIEFCQARTYFHAAIEDEELRVAGWSNASTTRGIIYHIIQMFDHADIQDIRKDKIYFHTDSRLADNLTITRADSVREMIKRIRKTIEQ